VSFSVFQKKSVLIFCAKPNTQMKQRPTLLLRGKRRPNDSFLADQLVNIKRTEFVPDGEPFVADETTTQTEIDSHSVHSSSSQEAEDDECCFVCGSTRDWATMMKCSNFESGCKFSIHRSCYGLERIPEQDIFCSEDCKTQFESRDGGNDFQPNDNFFVDDRNAASESEDEAKPAISWVDRSDGCSSQETIVRNLLVSRAHGSSNYLSAQKFAEDGSGFSKKLFGQTVEWLCNRLKLSAEQKEMALKSSPAENIHRLLLQLGTPKLIEKEIKVSFCKTEMYVDFSFRCPFDTAASFRESVSIGQRGRLYEWNENPCLQCGHHSNTKSLVEKFAQEMSFDPHSKANVTMPVNLYVDETQSKSRNVSLTPCWLWPATLCPSTRQRLKEDGHALVFILPDLTTVQYRDGSGASSSEIESKLPIEKRNEMMKKLRSLCLEAFFAHWKKHERDGMKFRFGGTEQTSFRIVLFRFVTDMKERRTLLGFKENKYYCSSCYDHAGSEDIKPLPGMGFGEKRTIKCDQELRRPFLGSNRSPQEEAQDEKDFNKQFGNRGIFLNDKCVFTREPKCRIFFIDSPSEWFCHCSLHNKDGVIHHFLSICELLLPTNYVARTIPFGNSYLGTKKYNTHVMEKTLESFRFIVLALAVDEELQKSKHLKLILDASVSLLKVIDLLGDPCPGLIDAALREAIGEFETGVRSMLDAAKEVNGDQTIGITPKMHERE
jgi:hypothetical protein